MPKYIGVELSESQEAELEKVRHQHPKAYMRERAAAVLKVAAGERVSVVAEKGLLTRHEPETVHHWIKNYLAHGLQGWNIQSGRGRKAAFSPQSPEAVRKTLDQLIHVAPPNRSRWTLALIGEAVSWLRGRSLVCVWKTLRRLGIVYKRGREYVHSPDPDYALKLAYIEAARQQAQHQPEQFVLLYEDEITYYRRPSLSRGYALVRSTEPKARLGHTSNKKRRIAGSLNATTGQFHAQQRAHFGVAQLIRYYQQLEAAYPHAKTLYLVQDNWPVHRHPQLLNFFLTSRIVPLFLPTYAPWTNPTEKVWLRLKRDVLHLHPFEDNWTELIQAVEHWFVQWLSPSSDLLHFVGLFPP